MKPCAFIAAAGLLAAWITSVPGEQYITSPLSAADQERLNRDKVLITAKTMRQVFEPYIDAQRPVFITSDAVLNAYHVLFEESVMAVEERYADDLPDLLRSVLAKLPESPPAKVDAALFTKARKRAQVVIGTALLLADPAWEPPADLKEEVRSEAGRAIAASGVYLPVWLLPAEEGFQGFDYAIFRPQGAYTRSPFLERYFRATRWLQTIPFRFERDEELMAAALLTPVWRAAMIPSGLPGVWQSLAGRKDDLDLASLDQFDRWPPLNDQSYLDYFRGRVDYVLMWRGLDTGADSENEDPFAASALNNQARTQKRARPAIRCLSAIRLPDAALFQKTTNAEHRLWPSGLEMAAAKGSQLASGILGKEVMQQVTANLPFFESETSLYGETLDCYAQLFQPEPDAPEFMKSDLWQRKTLNTAMSSWAQLRHTWALQAKENYITSSDIDSGPGFVEPCPAFFAAFERLVRASCDAIEKTGIETPVVRCRIRLKKIRSILPDLKIWAAETARWRAPIDGRLAKKERVSEAELARAPQPPEDLQAALKAMGMYADLSMEHTASLSYTPPGSRMIYEEEAAAAEGLRQWIHFSGWDPEELLARMIKDESRAAEGDPACLGEGVPLLSRWSVLAEIAGTLETLAHKQLRGISFNERDKEFLTGFGPRLGFTMFYDGNSWDLPKDDAPRTSVIFSHAGGPYLHAGIGRPREIRVLYPWQGKEIECTGAVLTYYEFQRPARLSDAEWRKELSGRETVPAPDWLQPIMSSPQAGD